MINPIKKTIDLGDGRTITIETGKLAKQADGAVEVRMGNTMLLATVVSATGSRRRGGFYALTSRVLKRNIELQHPEGITKKAVLGIMKC